MTRVAKLILNSLEVNQQKDEIVFKYFSKSLLILQHEVVVDESLSFTCAVFGWFLVDDHIIYKTSERSVRNITVSQLPYEIKNLNIYCGIPNITDPEVISHCIPSELSLDQDMNKPEKSFQFKRVKNYELLIKTVGTCETCLNFEKLYKRKEKGKLQRINEPACLNAPLSNTHSN